MKTPNVTTELSAYRRAGVALNQAMQAAIAAEARAAAAGNHLAFARSELVRVVAESAGIAPPDDCDILPANDGSTMIGFPDGHLFALTQDGRILHSAPPVAVTKQARGDA